MKASAKTIVKKQPDTTVMATQEQIREAKVIKIAKWSREFRDVCEQIAEDKFCYINHYYPGGKAAFPNDHELQYVRKYYPHAKGGPLYVDEPRYEEDIKKCETKAFFLRGQGHRYIIIKQGMSFNDALEQLA